MNTGTPPSRKYRTLNETWEWYDILKSSVERERERLATLAVGSTSQGSPVNLRFQTPEEIRAHFEKHLQEFDQATSLLLFASAEAELRVDFQKRTGDKKKDSISRSFRDLNKIKEKKGGKIRLVELLDKWVENKPSVKKTVSAFKGLKKHRDWLAHGRYWIPKLGRTSYDPHTYREIISQLLSALSLHATK